MYFVTVDTRLYDKSQFTSSRSNNEKMYYSVVPQIYPQPINVFNIYH